MTQPYLLLVLALPDLVIESSPSYYQLLWLHSKTIWPLRAGAEPTGLQEEIRAFKYCLMLCQRLKVSAVLVSQ